MNLKCLRHNMYHEDASIGNMQMDEAYRLGISQTVTRNGVKERCMRKILADPRLSRPVR